ncbi:galactosylceramide sulfotransferase-like isoform X2 [Ptychodera flava]|uniref:galactosylceramide sulfotransferase-like isoform X2 n=1 Tax=Ptychodera flava TaxID=63121 RepID=UPI00396A1937
MRIKLFSVTRLYSGCSRYNVLVLLIFFVFGVYIFYHLTTEQGVVGMSDAVINSGELVREEQVGVHALRHNDRKKSESCRPVNKFVFIKPEKTGGSTVSTILFRYGMKNNLVAALKPRWTHICVIKMDKEKDRLGIVYYNCSDFPGYDYLCQHIQTYNRAELNRIVHDATYMTIIRSPYTHLKSKFYFSRQHLNLSMSPDPFAIYLKDIEKTAMKDEQLRKETNSFHFRFGLNIAANESFALEDFRRFDDEIDLVMIMEYMDESLVLLKKLMCWDFDDMVYHSCKVHQNYQPPTTEAMRDIITKVSRADIRLYNYFNRTFWEKVENYDGDFEADLEEFRSVQKAANAKCETDENSVYCTNLQKDVHELAKVVYDEQAKWMC